MAAGGQRQLPAHLLPWIILLQQIAEAPPATKNPDPAAREILEPIQTSFAHRQRRLLLL
jgi:hypothetical protein